MKSTIFFITLFSSFVASANEYKHLLGHAGCSVHASEQSISRPEKYLKEKKDIRFTVKVYEYYLKTWHGKEFIRKEMEVSPNNYFELESGNTYMGAGRFDTKVPNIKFKLKSLSNEKTLQLLEDLGAKSEDLNGLEGELPEIKFHLRRLHDFAISRTQLHFPQDHKDGISYHVELWCKSY